MTCGNSNKPFHYRYTFSLLLLVSTSCLVGNASVTNEEASLHPDGIPSIPQVTDNNVQDPTAILVPPAHSLGQVSRRKSDIFSTKKGESEGVFVGEGERRSLSGSPSPNPTRSPTTPGTIELSEIETPPSTRTVQEFAKALCVDGNDLIVLSKFNAHYFEKDLVGDWSHTGDLQAPTTPITFLYDKCRVKNGRALISGSEILGTPRVRHLRKIGGVWTLVQTMSCPDGSCSFGSGLDFTEDVLAVGANAAGVSGLGAVYIFNLVLNRWEFSYKLDASPTENIGSDVMFSDSHLIVGTADLDGIGTGSAVKFPLVNGLPQRPHITLTGGFSFGERVFHHRGLDLVAAKAGGSILHSAGNVRVYRNILPPQTLGPFPAQFDQEYGGGPMGSRGDLLFIPSPLRKPAGSTFILAGSVYVYKLRPSGTSYTFVRIIEPTSAFISGKLGTGLASSEEDTFFGAPGDGKGKLYHVKIGPTASPTRAPTASPTTSQPSISPTTSEPTTADPTASPVITSAPSTSPSSSPSTIPTVSPSSSAPTAPIFAPTRAVEDSTAGIAFGVTVVTLVGLGAVGYFCRTWSSNASGRPEHTEPPVAAVVTQNPRLEYATAVSSRYGKDALVGEAIDL